MKKLFILFLFFFFIPIVNADYQVTDYKIDMTVLENGDIEVIEVFKMEGEYNGFERIINYKNNYIGYKGEKLVSVDGNLYNISSVQLNEVRAINYDDKLTLEELKENGDLFKKVDMATKGEHGVYTITKEENSEIFKIYNPSKMNKDFYLSYTLKNVVINHNDVSEFALFLFNQIEEEIKSLEITIHVPNNLELLKGYVHKDGTIKIIDEETLQINVKDLKVNDNLDIRVVFDNNIVKANKVTTENVLEKIEVLEEKFEEEINTPLDDEYIKIQEEAYQLVTKVEQTYNRTDYENAVIAINKLKEKDELKIDLLIRLMNVEPKIERKETITKVILSSILLIWSIGIIIVIYQLYKKNSKNINNKLELIDIGYIMRRKITNNDFAALLLSLNANKKITITKTNGTYKLKQNTKDLSIIEQKLIKLIFEENEETTFTKIQKRAINNYDNFINNYSNLLNTTMNEINKKHYYENLFLIKIIGIFYSILGIIMSTFLIGKDTYFSSYITLFIAVITLIFLVLFYKRTPDGLKKYQELKILKNNIDNSNEEDIIKSISLGCFDNASKFYQDIVYQFDDVIKSAYLSKKQKHEEFIKI